MGKRNEWSQDQINKAVSDAGGNLTEAARSMNSTYGDVKDKVSRQNLQTWVNDAQPAVGLGDATAETMDNFVLANKNRNLTNRNNALARELRAVQDSAIAKADVIHAISTAVLHTEPSWPMPYVPKQADGRGITIELLFSDLQIGKLMDGYDSEVAQRRVDEWIEVATSRMAGYQMQGYKIEKIILAVLGDVIESDKKHENSGRGCDIGTADQMKLAIELLFHRVLKRLALFNVPMDVVMVTGNHDHDGHGLAMFMPGREHLSWPMYNAIAMLSEAAGIQATFYIPEGSHHIHTVYGTNVLYEHGVGVATSEAAMKAHVAKRINQTKDYIHLFRMG